MAVDNYLFRYSDGTTGNSPYRRDASGNIILNSSGGIADEGTFLGRPMADGSVNQSPMGNVTADGRVNTYGGYSTTADNYYSNANEAAWGRPSNVGSRPANGYGYASDTGAEIVNTKPLQVGGGAAFGGSSSGVDYGSTRPMQSAGGLPSASPAGSISSYTAWQNPYLSQMGDVMVGQMTDNFNRSVVPAIGSAALASGGYGGSRQGVMEANANNDLQRQIAGGLANLYGNGFNTGLQYDLGLKNNQLGYANLDRNINNDNLNWQMQGANFGLGIYDRMQQANNLGLQTGSQIQNTPLNYWNQFSQGANSLGQGYGTSTSTSGGNPLMGAIGGAQLGSQVGNWWSSQNNNSSPGTAWYSGNSGMGD